MVIPSHIQKVFVFQLCLVNMKLKVFPALRSILSWVLEKVVSRQQDGCNCTGSATAVLIWKNITVSCDNELQLKIFIQISL